MKMKKPVKKPNKAEANKLLSEFRTTMKAMGSTQPAEERFFQVLLDCDDFTRDEILAKFTTALRRLDDFQHEILRDAEDDPNPEEAKSVAESLADYHARLGKHECYGCVLEKAQQAKKKGRKQPIRKGRKR